MVDFPPLYLFAVLSLSKKAIKGIREELTVSHLVSLQSKQENVLLKRWGGGLGGEKGDI